MAIINLKILVMKSVKFRIIVPALLLLLGAASCKDNGEKGNDPMENTTMETDARDGDRKTGAEVKQLDTVGISPDSTQASPPEVTKP